jgi:hypothetical protein
MKLTGALGDCSRNQPHHSRVRKAHRRAERSAVHRAVRGVLSEIHSRPPADDPTFQALLDETGIEADNKYLDGIARQAAIDAASDGLLMPARMFYGYDD